MLGNLVAPRRGARLNRMRIIVTGGSGKLGRTVVSALRDEGNHVTNLDRFGERGAFTQVDLTDFGQVIDAIAGVDDRHDGTDAIVHLAAIPAPGLASDAATFHNNMLTTFNVFQTARRLGIGASCTRQRDRAGPAVRRAAALHPGRRGVPRAPREHLLPREAPRGADGDRVRAPEPRALDHGTAILERHGPRRLRALSPRSTPTRRCASGTCGATSTVATARRP